jgi:hypothetical protein
MNDENIFTFIKKYKFPSMFPQLHLILLYGITHSNPLELVIPLFSCTKGIELLNVEWFPNPSRTSEE